MTNRTTIKTTKAIKGILLFSILSFFPVAVLLADARPLNGQEIEKMKIERSISQWNGLKANLSQVLKKADRLSQYKAIK
jgi:hypothetical protein